MSEPFKFIIESGVVRFDASGNLFVHLRHSKTDAHPFEIEGGMVSALPETERRARFLGSGSGPASGAFQTTDDLIRGFTIELKGYDSAALNEDGHLEVIVPGVLDAPDWSPVGSTIRLGRSGDALRLWEKSSFPESVTKDDGSAPPPPPAAKTGSGPGPKKPPAEPAKTYNPPEKTAEASEPVTKLPGAKTTKAAAEKKPQAEEKPKAESMARARGDKSPNASKIGATGVKAEGGKSKTTVDSTPRTAGSKNWDPGGKKKSGGGGCALLGGVMLLGMLSAVASLAVLL